MLGPTRAAGSDVAQKSRGSSAQKDVRACKGERQEQPCFLSMHELQGKASVHSADLLTV